MAVASKVFFRFGLVGITRLGLEVRSVMVVSKIGSGWLAGKTRLRLELVSSLMIRSEDNWSSWGTPFKFFS